jgi:5-methylcytosine-specific restriction enzyme A
MPYAPKAACPVCRRAGCTQHKPQRKRARSRPETWAERKAKAHLVQEWIRDFGYVCPGYECPPHYSQDLTADHITPVALGGDVLGPMQVLCRQCNSRRGTGGG